MQKERLYKNLEEMYAAGWKTMRKKDSDTLVFLAPVTDPLRGTKFCLLTAVCYFVKNEPFELRKFSLAGQHLDFDHPLISNCVSANDYTCQISIQRDEVREIRARIIRIFSPA